MWGEEMREFLRGTFFNFNLLTKKCMYMFKKSTTAPKLIINFSTDAWMGWGCTAVHRLQAAEPVLTAGRGDIKSGRCVRKGGAGWLVGPQQAPTFWSPPPWRS